MASEKKKYRFIIVAVGFAAYTFIASERIPAETVFTFRWISSLGTGLIERNPRFARQDAPQAAAQAAPPRKAGTPDAAAAQTEAAATAEAAAAQTEAATQAEAAAARNTPPVPAPAAPSSKPVPFELGKRFGYVDTAGNFIVNKEKKANVYLSDSLFVEYEGRPEKIVVYNNQNEPALEVEGKNGYPFFLDNTVFVLDSEQSSITRLDANGNAVWTRDFAAPLTCVDAANGIMVAGLLDGTAEILGPDGERLFLSEPSGSRIAAVFGCAISSSGTAVAVVRGIDRQRFMYFERFGPTWRSGYHDFLEDGLRRPVYVAFVDHDRRVVFEREDGAGIYDVAKRQIRKIPLNGRITALDKEGGGNILLLLTEAEKKRLIAIQYPGTTIIEAPFESKSACLVRSGSTVFVGGDETLASFTIEQK